MSDATDARPEGGWGWPMNSRKAHWFHQGDNQSLCGRWLFLGPKDPAPLGIERGADDCAECDRRLRRITPLGALP